MPAGLARRRAVLCRFGAGADTGAARAAHPARHPPAAPGRFSEQHAAPGRGTAINYAPATPLLPFLARQQSANFGFGLRPSPRFRLDGTYLYTRLFASARQMPIFNDHILRAKVNYQFTRRLSLRTIVDYHAVLPNAALVALDANKRLTGDVLVTYLVNPGTALYVGYTDLYENLQFGALPAGLRTGAPETSTGRQFFVKMSYLFRF